MKYWIGDLCYVLHEVWHEVCDHLEDDGNWVTLKDGRRYALMSTAYGDGAYLDLQDREYFVDSGTIGIILVDDIKDGVHDNRMSLGHIQEFVKEPVCFTKGGKLIFTDSANEVEIDTDPEPIDDYWDSYDGDPDDI